MFYFAQVSDQMKSRLPFYVYLLGLLPLGYWQGTVRALLGDWLAFAVCIAYLLLLRLIGWSLVRFVEYSHKRSIREHNRLVEERKK